MDQIEESLGTLEETIHIFSFIVVIQWVEYDSVDSGMSVHHLNLLLVYSSLLDFSLGLENHNGIASFFSNLVYISLVDWVWTNDKILIWNFMGEETAHEVTISFVENIVDDEVSFLLTLFISAFISLSTLI